MTTEPGHGTVDNSESTPAAPGRLSNRVKIALAAAGALVLVAVGVVIGSQLGDGSQVAADPEPTAEAPVVPGPVEGESPEPTEEDPGVENPGEGSVEIYDQTVSVEQMDAMSIEEFAKLSYADRAAYFHMKAPNRSAATIDEVFEPEVVPGFFWQGIRIDAVGQSDPTEGAKMISALAYYTTEKSTGEATDSYMTSAASILNNGGSGVGISDVMVYVDHGTTQMGEDRDGNPIEFTNISYKLTSQTGEDVAPVRTAQVFQIPIRLDDGRVVVSYPMGYTIDGQQSPVEGYPY